MKGLIFVGQEQVQMKEFPDPEPGHGEAMGRWPFSYLMRNDGNSDF